MKEKQKETRSKLIDFPSFLHEQKTFDFSKFFYYLDYLGKLIMIFIKLMFPQLFFFLVFTSLQYFFHCSILLYGVSGNYILKLYHCYNFFVLYYFSGQGAIIRIACTLNRFMLLKIIRNQQRWGSVHKDRGGKKIKGLR